MEHFASITYSLIVEQRKRCWYKVRNRKWLCLIWCDPQSWFWTPTVYTYKPVDRVENNDARFGASEREENTMITTISGHFTKHFPPVVSVVQLLTLRVNSKTLDLWSNCKTDISSVTLLNILPCSAQSWELVLISCEQIVMCFSYCRHSFLSVISPVSFPKNTFKLGKTVA